jgi:hypothetical protein
MCCRLGAQTCSTYRAAFSFFSFSHAATTVRSTIAAAYSGSATPRISNGILVLGS